MKTMLIATALICSLMIAYASHATGSASTARDASALAPNRVLDPPDVVAVGDRYLVPALPAEVVDRLPAAAANGDQYLAERIALAELVVGDRILAAEDQANSYANDLPGFADVLLADGFRQDANGAWYYDRYESWMRYALNR